MCTNSLPLKLLCAALLSLAAGCATMDRAYRGVTSVTDPDKTRLRGGVKWMNPQPPLREVSGEKMVVYLRTRNTSASPVPLDELYARVHAGLEAAGYRVTRDRSEATYTVNADVRYFGENASKDGGAGLLAGAILGGAAGAATGHAIGGDGRATGIGAAGGAAAGAAIANIMANRNKMVEIDMVVDLRIGERIPSGVATTRRTEDEQRVTHGDSTTTTGGAAEGGRSSAGTTETQQVEIREDFLYHHNRLAAHAVKMGLTPDEALPFLTERIAAALSSALP